MKSKIEKAGLTRHVWAGLRNRFKTKKLIMSNLTLKLAEECKKRTKAYFDGLPKPVKLSEKGITAVQIIKSSSFGCAAGSVADLMNLILGEDVKGGVTGSKRPHPTSGALILFPSTRLSPGKWVPTLCVGNESNGAASFINNIEDKTSGGSLGGDQVAGATQPSDEQIDEYFAAMNAISLRVVLNSDFGFEIASKD